MQRYGNAGCWKCAGNAGKPVESAGRTGGSARKTAGMMTAALIAAAAAVFLTGCGAGGNAFPVDRSVIYIAKDGGLYTVLSGAYDAAKDYYSEDELAERVGEEAAAYNEECSADAGQEGARQTRTGPLGSEWTGTRRQEDPVVVEDVRLENGTASVVLRYSDAGNLIRFTEASQDTANHTEKLSVTMVGEGLPDVPGADEAWTDAKRNDPVTPEQIRRRTDLHLVTVSGPVTVQTEKRILYYSGAVSLLDKHTAQIEDGDAYIVYK